MYPSVAFKSLWPATLEMSTTLAFGAWTLSVIAVCLRQCGVALAIPALLTAVAQTFVTV